MKKHSAPLPAITAPNTGAVQPWNGNGMSDSDDEFQDDNRKLELEYKGNNENNQELVKKTQEAEANDNKKTEVENKKNNSPTTTTTTTNNGVIKVSMVGEIAMSNFHQCK